MMVNINNECLGCQLANQLESVHVVYEDEHVCCFLDHDPINEGHTLILPKNHVVEMEELDMETATAVWKAAVKISKVLKYLFNPDGITICQNGGRFNELKHFHMHVIPRYEGQPFYTDDWSDNTEQREKLEETKAKLRTCMKKYSY
jgi:histidine triad (HIT) family protein